MSFKRIMILVLILAMTVSAFAPAIQAFEGAFSNAEHHHENDTKKEEIDYVSLGDYLANGFGLDGYEQNGGPMGFVAASEESFPVKFAAWLAGSNSTQYNNISGVKYIYNGTKSKVSLTQLAMNSARVEDLLYMLQNSDGRLMEMTPEQFAAEKEKNYWTYNEFLANNKPDGISEFLWAGLVAGTYESAIRNADVISLAIGNVNFGDYLTKVVINSLKGDDTYDYMTVASALGLCVENKEAREKIEALYSTAQSYLSGMGFAADMIETVCGRLAYIAASYLVTYEKLIDLIVEINPDIEIVIVPVVNTFDDISFELELGGETYSAEIREGFDYICNAVNSYIAAVPALRQFSCEYENAKFYYAEIDGEVEMLGNHEYVVDHEVLLKEFASLLGEHTEFDLDAISINDLKNFEAAYKNGPKAYYEYFYNQITYNGDIALNAVNENHMKNVAEKTITIATYFGFVEAFVESLNTTRFDLSAYLSINDSTFSDVMIGEGLLTVENRDEAYNLFVADVVVPMLKEKHPDLADSIDLDYALNYLDTSEGAVLKAVLRINSASWALKNATTEVVLNNTALSQFLALYGKVALFDGLTTSPSAEGHATIADAVINAYENGYTVKDKTIENFKEALEIAWGLIVEYYDEAYALGYDYLDKNGYIKVAVDALNDAIDAIYLAIDEVNGGLLGTTDDLTDLMVDELEATIKTLEELRDVLKNGNAGDVAGFVDAILALEDDLNTHISNIYAILEKAAIDVNQIYLVPAFNEMLKILNEEIIPVIKATVEPYVAWVVQHVTEKCAEIYDLVYPIYCDVLAISKETFDIVFPILVEIYIYANDAYHTAIEVFGVIAETMLDVYDSATIALEKAAEVFEGIVDTLLKINADIRATLELVGEIYAEIMAVAYEIYGDVSAAIEFVDKTIANIITDINGNYNGIEDIPKVLEIVFIDIVDALIEAGLLPEEAAEIAADIVAKITKTLIEVYDAVEDALEFAQNVFDIIVKASKPILENREKIYEIAIKVYTEIVAFIIANEEEIELALEIAREAFFYILDAVQYVYNNWDEVYATATDAYATLVDVIIKAHGAYEAAKEIYDYAVSIIADILGTVEDAAELLEAIYGRIIDKMLQTENSVQEMLNKIDLLYNEVLDFVSKTYDEALNTAEFVNTVYVACVEMLLVVKADTENRIFEASNGSYELKDDSVYVALGYDTFGEKLAEKLYLGEKFSRFGISGDYLEAVAKADLVTVKLDNDSYVGFAEAQVRGVIADIITSNEDLMSLYNHPVFGNYIKDAVLEAGFDLEAQTIELEWDKYLDAEGKEALDDVLERFKEELVKADVPEYYYISLQPLVDAMLEKYGLAGLPGMVIDIDPITIPVVELMAYAFENALYGYASFTNDMANVIANIRSVAPEATIVFVGVTDPLEIFDPAEYGIDFIEYSDYRLAADVAVGALNAHLYSAAVVNDNVIFVEDNDADAIYDALHVYCDHVYDDCLDGECNRCHEIRVIPGHSFTNYVFNNDAACEKDGTETAHCDNCDAVNTRVASGTALKHDWKEATCTTPKTCKICNKVSGTVKPHNWEAATCTTAKQCKTCGAIEGKALGHNFGDWKEVEPATRKDEGCEERVCRACGIVETRIIPVIPPKYEAGTIVAVVLSAIGFACAVSLIALLYLRKKDILKD